MITEQKQNRRKKHRESTVQNSDILMKILLIVKYITESIVRQLINNSDMLGENKQSIIWLNQKIVT
jgi:hypothetical protein